MGDLIRDLLPRARRSGFRHLWIVGVCLYAAAIVFIGWRRIRDTLFALDPAMLAAMAACCAATLWLRALKWRLVLGPGKSAVGLFFLSKAGGSVLPARVGELAPLLSPRHRSARLGAWIVLDRLLETAATVGLGVVGAVVLGLPDRLMIAVFLAAFVCLAIFPYYIFRRPRLFEALGRWFPESSAFRRIFDLLAAVSGEIADMGRAVPKASAISVIATCLDLQVSVLLYLSFGHRVAFALLAVVQCAHGLASILPFAPNATGIPYLVAAGLLYRLGGVPEDALAAAVGVNMAIAATVFWTSFVAGMTDLRRDPEGDARSEADS